METTSMNPIRFDKLRFVKKLQESGQDPVQAEALADALDEALEQSQGALLTKSEFDIKLAQMETRLTMVFNSAIYKMTGIIIAGLTVMMGLMKFIN